ncbi:MAG: pyridoxal phosphate-dependent aminotransferase [Gammaproteobacteria bacterium]
MADLMDTAARVNRIKSFHVMALLDRAKQLEAQGRDIIHLEVGEPDFATPDNVVEAGVAAMRQGKTRYTAPSGLPELRRAIAGFYRQRYGVTVDPCRVIVTPGASGAISLVTALLFNPGDGVLLADPGYPCNDNFLHLLGALPQRVAAGPDTGYQLTAAQVASHWQENTRGVWVASPSNPTGTLLDLAALQALHAAVDARKGALLVDEIYHGLTYGVDAPTALALSDPQSSLFVINSFSKYFNMTGWRLGWLVAPECHMEALDRLAQNFFLAAPTVAQYAALEAFSDTSIALYEQRRQILQQRRDYLLQALPALGFQIRCVPQGAFYLYCDVSTITGDSFAFCQQLLEQTGVAITPGIDFGDYQAQQHVRIAYTQGQERLAQAVARIGGFIGKGGEA